MVYDHLSKLANTSICLADRAKTENYYIVSIYE